MCNNYSDSISFSKWRKNAKTEGGKDSGEGAYEAKDIHLCHSSRNLKYRNGKETDKFRIEPIKMKLTIASLVMFLAIELLHQSSI